MMSVTLRRALLAGSALAVSGLMSTAQAEQWNINNVKVVVDTTVSLGVSVRATERERAFLPEGNGGNVDPRAAGTVVFTGPLPALVAPLGPTAPFTLTNNANNFDGSINTDDGRLNFDNGDLIGATAKATHDIEVSWENFTLFSRVLYFYDAVLDNDDAGDRSILSDKTREIAGSNFNLLDLFVSGNFDIDGMPLNVRFGRQVVSWGEGTFLNITNGINTINPIDVTAFRRPGAEIKEGLLPQNMIYASLGLPDGFAVEGFYQLEWEETEIDPAGTPFAGADIIRGGSGRGGNENLISFLSGSPFMGARRNCNVSRAVLAGILPNPLVADPNRLDCTDSPFVNYNTPFPTGLAEVSELDKIAAVVAANPGIDPGALGAFLPRGRNLHPDSDGQYGLAARYYAQDLLGGTEFGFYYTNLHSRLPFIAEFANTPQVRISVQGDNANFAPGGNPLDAFTPRAAGLAGCSGSGLGAYRPGGNGTFFDPRIAILDTIPVSDPQGLINPGSIAAAQAILDGVSGGATVNLAALYAGAGNQATYGLVARMNCAAAYSQAVNAGALAGLPLLPVLSNGAETFDLAGRTDVLLEFPEDIKTFGISFNTTVLGWGLQGEISYRPDAPFQVDTDSLTIAAAIVQCALAVLASDAGAQFNALNTVPGTDCNPANIGNQFITGVIENQMWTANIGTTATFTSSDAVIEWTGADLGILLTEVGVVYVPGVEDTYLNNNVNQRIQQFQNNGCQGTDLGLGGLLALDAKRSEACRPTDWSVGYTLLARLDYNNAFGSGWVISPQIAFSHDVYGYTPAPYSSFLEDRMSASLSVSGTLNNVWRVNVGYTNNFNGHQQNKAQDQDFVSISGSVSF